jgi:tRNA A-37 threonylcarbamoyl transferase component Bud32
MPNNSICPKCNAPIAVGAPQGLCPKCVLLGVATAAGAAKPRSKEPQAPSPQEIAPHFPELEVLELISVGGMGAVYKARQTKLGRLVALKVLASTLADDPEFLERFDREARVLGRLNHPGIVTVFDSGMAGPCAYLLMEFVDGVNLRQAMQSGGFKPSEALAVTQEICSALEYAHGQGILHRDIKPENILIDATGRMKIADFGIAKLVGDQGPDHATLTVRGAILGSMSYMAPEQFDAPGDVDQRADIYSLGVVLYELLTGELPRGRFGPPSEKSAVDARIDEIVMRTLEREREARFQNVHQMKTQVDAATLPGFAPSPASGAAPGRKTARFATASLVCTVLSVLAGMFVGLPLLMSTPTNRDKPQGGLLIITALVALLIAAMAGTGILLATRALREIRTSGGKLAGFTRAMVAALTWPALIVISVAVVGLAVLISGISERDALLLLIAVFLLTESWIGVAMMRRVHAWAKSPSSPSPQKYVWSFAGVACLTSLCFVLFYLAPSKPVTPQPSGTRMELKTMVAAGKMVTFRVVRIDAEGNETPLELGGSILPPAGRDFHTTLKIVSTQPRNSGERQKLSASYTAPSGETFSKSISLDEKWKFHTAAKGASQVIEGNKERLELATRDDWRGKKVETLYVELTGTTQKDGKLENQ